MQKKLTITIDEAVYQGLYDRVGAGKISRFIEQLVRPHVLAKELDDAYAAMARDEEREAEAFEWAEGLMGDAANDARWGVVDTLPFIPGRGGPKDPPRGGRQQRRIQSPPESGSGRAGHEPDPTGLSQ